MINYIIQILIIFLIPIYSFGQESTEFLNMEREKLGLQVIDKNWKLDAKNFINSENIIIIDTIVYQPKFIIEHWKTVKNESIKIEKVLQYDFRLGVSYMNQTYIKNIYLRN